MSYINGELRPCDTKLLVLLRCFTMPASPRLEDWIIARGFRFAGLHCGIKSDPARKDLAVILSDVPCAAAGVFTQNRICAAPVQVSRKRVPSAATVGVVLNAGNANACTGAQGIKAAERMTQILAEQVGAAAEQVLVCSTGIIGRALPLQVIEPGILQAAASARADAGGLYHAAHAIMTTDTRSKVSYRQVELNGRTYHFSGLAKGAAMIGPNMATMLGVVCTDAPVLPQDLQTLLHEATAKTFNCISVEGHMSTNDTVLVLANGQGGGVALQGEALQRFGAELTVVCEELAVAIVQDAEGITKLLKLTVEGLRSDAEAHRVAKTVAESALVKTALFGNDPNWGRFVSAAGYAGVSFEEKHLSLWLGEYLLYDCGTPTPTDIAALGQYLKENAEIEARLVFTLGQGRCRFWTSDLSYEYVRLNADYTT